MKLTARLVAVSVAAISTAHSWTPPSSWRTRSTTLQALATPPTGHGSSSNRREMEDEQGQSGRILEGGAVIDFSSVKASDTAEAALARARQTLTSITTNAIQYETPILGINQEVIDEVGHALGEFATEQEVQDCAAYLRSMAPAGLLKSRTEAQSPQFTDAQKKRFKQIFAQAYDEAGEVTGAFAKTFYMGTMLLGEAARKAIWAVYVWCRRTDEIVDAPRDNSDDMLRDLSWWELRLENLFQYGEVADVYDLVLLDCLVKYPNMDITPFMDMIRGMLMDVPELGQDRYDRFDELHLYCYRVAGTVGLMSLPIFGCAQGYDYEVARYVEYTIGRK